ncbi:cell surface protein [Lachnospiraceae bacterium KM106-2]|nr:cell surface protein [Lachnospiraceae bacterium KM106-2]
MLVFLGGILTNKTTIRALDKEYVDVQNETGEFRLDGTKLVYYFNPTGNGVVKVPEGVTSIGTNVFRHEKKVVTVILPSTMKEIEHEAFYDCEGLEEINFPVGLERIGEMAFFRCAKLKKIQLPNTVTTIEGSAFSGCESVTELTIPNALQTLAGSAFSECKKIKKVVLPNTLTVLEGGVFSDCTSLTYVKMPSKLKEIESGVFNGCTKLDRVRIPDTVEKIDKYVFDDSKFVVCSEKTKVFKSVSDMAQLYNVELVKSNKTGITRKKYIVLKSESGRLYFNTDADVVPKWSSSNQKIATVSSNGTVKAKKTGNVKITATYQGKKYTCTVTVLPRDEGSRIEQVESNYNLKNLTDYEKIWAINLWLRHNVKYDHTLKVRNDALISGKAVCEGYARAFELFMGAFKIPCQYVPSRANHAWNVVQIDDKWYHIDTTNNGGPTYTRYFLKPDSFIYQFSLFKSPIIAVSCNTTKIDKKYKSPQINKYSVTLKKGKTTKLSLSNNKKKIKWSSWNNKIATVSSSGKVKGMKKGKTTIEARIGDRVYFCDVKVK